MFEKTGGFKGRKGLRRFPAIRRKNEQGGRGKSEKRESLKKQGRKTKFTVSFALMGEARTYSSRELKSCHQHDWSDKDAIGPKDGMRQPLPNKESEEKRGKKSATARRGECVTLGTLMRPEKKNAEDRTHKI